MTHLYLIRHGENLANLTKEFSYLKVDYPLTPKGRLQAEQTASDDTLPAFAAAMEQALGKIYAQFLADTPLPR